MRKTIRIPNGLCNVKHADTVYPMQTSPCVTRVHSAQSAQDKIYTPTQNGMRYNPYPARQRNPNRILARKPWIIAPRRLLQLASPKKIFNLIRATGIGPKHVKDCKKSKTITRFCADSAHVQSADAKMHFCLACSKVVPRGLYSAQSTRDRSLLRVQSFHARAQPLSDSARDR